MAGGSARSQRGRWRWNWRRLIGWGVAYGACTVFALPALIAALWLGEPARRSEVKRARAGVVEGLLRPFGEFLSRPGAGFVLAFILVHKVGDTLANLTFRLLFNRSPLHQSRDRDL